MKNIEMDYNLHKIKSEVEENRRNGDHYTIYVRALILQETSHLFFFGRVCSISIGSALVRI